MASRRLLRRGSAFIVAASAALAVTTASPAATGKIAYSGDDYDIIAVEPDGSNEAILTAGTPSDRWPEWSPDGTKIAFTRWANGSWHLFVMSANGSNLRQLTTGTYRFIYGPAWSPDGTRIAFHEWDDNNFTEWIGIVNADGSGERVVAWGPGGTYSTEGAVDWSVNDEIIIANDAENGFVVVDPDGGVLRTIPMPARSDMPVWSPDGTMIAYERCSVSGTFTCRIRVMKADGSNDRRLTTSEFSSDGCPTGVEQFPTWSPDGTQIGFRFGGSNFTCYAVATAAVSGSPANRIPGTRPVYAEPDWGPGSVEPPPPDDTADIRLSQAGWPYGEVGTTVSYRLDVANDGPDAATQTHLTVATPAGVTVVGASPTGTGTCATLSPLACDLGEVASGATSSVTVYVRLDVEGNLGSLATVTSSAYDPGPDGNTLDVRTVGLPQSQPLAARYRPALLFDTGSSEKWRPLAIDRLLSESFKGNKRHQICYVVQGRRGSTTKCQNITSEFGFSNAFTFLDLVGSGDDSYTSYPCRAPGLNDCDTGPTSALYYEPTSDPGNGYRYVDFWWFFRWNDSPLLSGDHEGDWEGMVVALDPTGPPSNTGPPVAAYALYAAHDGQTWSAYLGNPANAHTPAYVGEGTHSSNPIQCFGGCGALERSYDGGRPWGRNNDAECAELCVRPLAAHASTWTFWPGRWGTHETGALPGGGSPPSPGNQGRYRCVKSLFTGNCPAPPFGDSLADDARSAPRAMGGFAVTHCDAWKGPHAAVVWCDEGQLEQAFLEHALDERVVPRVRIDDFAGHVVAAPGLTQAVGQPLAVGDVAAVTGPSAGGRELSVRVRRHGREWIASFSVPSLRAGERATIRVASGKRGPVVKVVVPGGRRIAPDEFRRVL